MPGLMSCNSVEELRWRDGPFHSMLRVYAAQNNGYLAAEISDLRLDF